MAQMDMKQTTHTLDAAETADAANAEPTYTAAEREEIHDLADEFLYLMPTLHRSRPQKQINESMRGEHFIVQYIMLMGRKVQPSEISAEMEISSARVAAALNGLEKKGLIEREIDPSDRRRILVDLTKEGRARASIISQHMVAGIRHLFEELGVDDSRELLRLMKKISAFMKVHHEDMRIEEMDLDKAAPRKGDDKG
jgi:DNA-binding MarR family transcriptional regulator